MNVSDNGLRQSARAIAVLLLLLLSSAVWPQVAAQKPATAEAQPKPPPDTLGRDTPKGTVLGFLSAARKGNNGIAALYLSTRLRGADAEVLAHQLVVVLDRRLPARLNELSDEPQGSLPDPLRPDEDLVGTIGTDNGELQILVERVDRGKAGKVWLFSSKTLKAIPDVFQELNTQTIESILPEFLVKTRLGSIPLFQWLTFFVGIPSLYLLTGLLNRLLSLGAGAFMRHVVRMANVQNPQLLPPPLRMLLLALAILWLSSRFGISLLARQFWSVTALIIAVAGCMWLLMNLNTWGERYLVSRRPAMSGSASVLRLVRRVMDGLVLFAGLLFTLHYFGINPSAALAGLGVGGIAVALAAQKTLENVIAGISLIADQAVRVGDTLKTGDILGTVEDVGLRSTRIRTPDRTVVCLPNGQIANMSLETLSARDKFWFHPLLALRYETTPSQLRSITSDIRKLLTQHSGVDPDSVRVRFLRLGAFSLDVDVFAYVFARDWNDFLEIQEELLLSVMDIVKRAGTEIAIPSQTMYVKPDSRDTLKQMVASNNGSSGADALHNKNKEDVHH